MRFIERVVIMVPRNIFLLHLLFHGVWLTSPGRETLPGNEIGSVGDIISKVNSNITWLVQGDIAMEIEGKKITSDQTKYWPNAIMFYTFAPGLSQDIITNIQTAMQQYSSQTCVKFVQRTTESNYVQFQSSQPGCYSYIGMTGQPAQVVNFGIGCNHVDIMLHEIGHSFGLIHEQNRPDRDTYVSINFNNVRPDLTDLFQIDSKANTLGLPYDFLSIMHFHQRAFTVNSQPTIIAKPPYANFQDSMGTGRSLTSNDLAAINTIYCALTTTTTAPTTPTPVTQPPVPTVTQPPVTQPPVTQPPVTQPPVPTVTQPPVTQPPVTQPPVTTPPAAIPIECIDGIEREVTVNVGQTIVVRSLDYPADNDAEIHCYIDFNPGPNARLRFRIVDTNLEWWRCHDPLEIFTVNRGYSRRRRYCRNSNWGRTFTVDGYADFEIESIEERWTWRYPRRMLVTVTGV